MISAPDMLEGSDNQQPQTFDQLPIKKILSAFSAHFFQVFREDTEDQEINRKKTEILEMFSNVFEKLNPCKYPGFAFAWVELISSPTFMPMMLSSKDEASTQERWFKMHQLLNKLFEFLKENIYEDCPNTPALEKLFEGTLKLCLIVLHDYPEFLCFYYFEFINHLPLYQTVHLRNMILAAYPRDMRLPDPVTLKIDAFPQSKSPFPLDRAAHLSTYVYPEELDDFKKNLDKFRGMNSRLSLENPDDDTCQAVCELLE